jgi:hypothetical protein
MGEEADGRWHYQLREGGFQHDAPPVLATCAPRLRCRCARTFQAVLAAGQSRTGSRDQAPSR